MVKGKTKKEVSEILNEDKHFSSIMNQSQLDLLALAIADCQGQVFLERFSNEIRYIGVMYKCGNGFLAPAACFVK